jgi:hypothetical protein
MSTCKIDINYMYIKYTFLSGNNLASFLVFKVLEAVALRVTIPLAVEALDFTIYLGRPRRTSNTSAVILWLLALWTLCLLTGLLEVCSLVDQQHIMLLLDLHLHRLEHSKQL